MRATRLPGKVLLPLGSWAVWEWAVRRLSLVAPVIVCIPGGSADDPLADAIGVGVVRGSEADVLGRFAAALNRVPQAEWILRATADNPLVLPDLILPAIERCMADEADYCSIEGTALGTTVEVIRREALVAINDLATVPDEREHATLGILRRPDRFCITRYVAPLKFVSSLRLTLDTSDDYAWLTALIGESNDPPEAWTWDRISQCAAANARAQIPPQQHYPQIQQLKERAWTPARQTP